METDQTNEPTTEKETWLAELTPEDLPRAFQELAAVIGVPGVARLAREYGGLQFYVPKYDALFAQVRNNNLRRDRATGMSYRELARKYDLTEVWVRQLVDHPDDNSKQINMFE